MNKRQKLVQQQFLNNEQEIIKKLEQVYGDSQKEIEDKIKNLTFTINDLKLEYSWLDDGDPEKEKIKSMIQSKIYQRDYQEQLKKQVDGILKRMDVAEFTNISDYLDTCYTDGFLGTMFDAHGQGIPIITPIDQEAMIRAVQLESKISKGLYTKLGEDVNLLKKKITAEVSRSIATGRTYAQTAKALENQSKIGYNKAIRIARTEGHRVQTTATMDAMEKAKEKGADVVKQWDSTLDARTRHSHVKVDGEIRELEEKFSNGLRYPGDPHGAAGEVINCRCALLQRARWAVEDEDKSFTKYNSFTGQVETFNSPEEYNEFKNAYFSQENKSYMNYVGQMENKYGTKNFAKVLDNMSEQEYNHYSKLLKNNPIFNEKALTNSVNSDTIDVEKFENLKTNSRDFYRVKDGEELKSQTRRLVKENGISQEDLATVKAYTGDGYRTFNAPFRKGGKIPAKAQQLSDVLDRMELQQDTKLNRIINMQGASKFFGVDDIQDKSAEELKNLLVGNTYVEKAFCSTSIGLGNFKGSRGKTIKMDIYAPQGTKGMYVAGYSAYGSEAEMLLKNGTNFKVHDVVEDEDGLVHVICEVLT